MSDAHRTEEERSKRLAHERLSTAAADGGFTTGGVNHWGPSEANCAAAAMERATYYQRKVARIEMMIDTICGVMKENGTPNTAALIRREFDRVMHE